MKTEVLNVVVTCTKQKRVPAPKNLRLESVKAGTLEERFLEWKRRLSSTDVEKHRVAELYCGDHWATVRKFHSNKFKVEIWIASAGYGLLKLTDYVAPYAATFSRGNADSIFRKINAEKQSEASQEWWNHLTTWPFSDHCRSINQLCATRADQSFLVVASDNYLRAIGEDLAKAVTQLESRQQLAILSAGCKALPDLSDCLLPCDARLQHLVGGARRSLNTRVAEYLITGAKSPPNFTKLKKRLTNVMQDLPDIPTFDRQPVSDDDVVEFILRELRIDPSLAHTPLLRQFRDEGRACEQSRFRNLYTKTKSEIS